FTPTNPAVINWAATNPAGTTTITNGQINRGDRVQLSVPTGLTGNIAASTCDTNNNATYHFQWTLIGRPAGSTAALSSTTDAQPIFIPDVAATASVAAQYKFLVTVFDSLGNSVSLGTAQVVGTDNTGALAGVSDCSTRVPTA